MAIYERTNADGKRVYRVQVDLGKLPDGSRDRITRVCGTKREAQKVEARFNRMKEANAGRSNRLTLEVFIDDYWYPAKVSSIRNVTMKGYMRDIRLRIRPYLGKLSLSDIKHRHIQSMIDKCPTHKAGTNARDTLSAILGHAVDLELLVRNPARGKYNYADKGKEKPLGEVVTDFNEHLRIVENAPSRELMAILTLGLMFGLRKGEILALDWENVDFKNRCIHIRKTYIKGTGKPLITEPKTKNSVRDLPMSEHAYGLMLGLCNDNGLIHMTGPVCGYKGERISPQGAYRRLKRYVDKSPDIPNLTPSSLRHSFATAAVLGGVNIANLSRWLGHTNISTTLNRYVKPLMGDLEDEAAKIDTLYELRKSA
jgi:integrase